MASVQNATLSASLSPTSPKVRRQPSGRRRAPSQLPPVQTVETHEAALKSIRAHLKSRTNYDSFPVSYRIIVLDTKLEVRKALQCLLYNGTHVLTTQVSRVKVLSSIALQVLCLLHYGTARRHGLLGCLLYRISSI